MRFIKKKIFVILEFFILDKFLFCFHLLEIKVYFKTDNNSKMISFGLVYSNFIAGKNYKTFQNIKNISLQSVVID